MASVSFGDAARDQIRTIAAVLDQAIQAPRSIV
jgi:hypothetical protein